MFNIVPPKKRDAKEEGDSNETEGEKPENADDRKRDKFRFFLLLLIL